MATDKPKEKSLKLVLTPEMHEQIKKEADAAGVPMGSWVKMVLSDRLRKS